MRKENMWDIVYGEAIEHKKHHHNLFVQFGEFSFSDPITIGYSELFKLILDELGMDLVHVKGVPPKTELVKKEENK